MKPRERVLATFAFKGIDRNACDLMEGQIWPELRKYFARVHNIQSNDEILNFLDTDFRWIFLKYVGPTLGFDEIGMNPDADMLGVATKYAVECGDKTNSSDINLNVIRSYSDKIVSRPLKQATTTKEVEDFPWVDPAWWQTPDFQDMRKRFPDHALVLHPGWFPLFCGAANAFGMEEALIRILDQPKLITAFLERQQAIYMDILKRSITTAEGLCDICWLGDDYASQDEMLFSPDLWRKCLKPLLKKQVAYIREHGILVLFHSCGAVRPILSDLVDIGVNGLLVFQTTARGMDPESIARDFGGKMVFYGGIDCQQLLTFGTPEQVREQVISNIKAFSETGGYIVANTHHGIEEIRGENILEMCRSVKK
jgi:uroporphyrinogen decarboxylase